MDVNNSLSGEQDSIAVDKEFVAAETQRTEHVEEGEVVESPKPSIAGFWRRFFAFTIDGIFIAVPLIIIGFIFRDLAFSIGPWGRIVGYVFIIPYWGYFNSEKRAGQTFGKLALKIAVVDKNNQFLSIKKSFQRAFILGIIFLFNGWALPFLQIPIIVILLTIIVFGGMLTLIYGLVFNRTTRQGIHDLLVGSHVVKRQFANTETSLPTIPQIHKRITFGLIGLSILFGVTGLLFGENQLTLVGIEASEWGELQELQSSLLTGGEFFAVSVHRVNRHQVGSGYVLEDLNIEVWAKTSCNRNSEYCDELIERIAHTAFEKYDNIENLSGMKIAVANRFDLGLARGSLVRGAAWSMEDWQKELSN